MRNTEVLQGVTSNVYKLKGNLCRPYQSVVKLMNVLFSLTALGSMNHPYSHPHPHTLVSGSVGLPCGGNNNIKYSIVSASPPALNSSQIYFHWQIIRLGWRCSLYLTSERAASSIWSCSQPFHPPCILKTLLRRLHSQPWRHTSGFFSDKKMFNSFRSQTSKALIREFTAILLFLIPTSRKNTLCCSYVTLEEP